MLYSGSAIMCLLTVFSSVQCFERLYPSNTLLLSEFEYDTDIQHDLDRNVYPHDERSYFFRSDSDGHSFPTDINLANLRPISPTPAFTLEDSYISPADVFPARAKRANRLRGKASKQHKREHLKEHAEDDDDDDEEEDEDTKASEVESTDVDDYAERYEQFIAKHFEDLESNQKKSASQRKAPKPGKKASDGNNEEEEEEEDGDYKFDRFDYSSSEDYERIKAESEEQSRQLAKDPKNCRTYEKDGMVCSVCHDPASDSASESCAYATEPHHRKYAYVKERNYDSKKDDPKQKKAEDDDDEDEEMGDESRELSAENRPERQTEVTTSPYPNAAKRRIAPHPLRKPVLRTKPHQSATNGGGYRYQPIDLRSNRANMKLRTADTEMVPVNGEDANIYVMDYGEQDEVAKVLAEFKARDWSNCRKGKRTGNEELTCYQCTDAAGVNHEECMYVSESRLVASELLQPPPAMSSKLRKRKKVIALSREQLAELEPPAAASDGSVAAKEKQTVKRTVSFRSFISGSGRGPTNALPSAVDSDGDERVIHYEHHISHEVP
uniref:Uncharacterized protein n=1 Tax=Anopheles farauti TaxID=69004 RepID=A0A182QNG4_9DIPT